jgi:putrescine aminotransferase
LRLALVLTMHRCASPDAGTIFFMDTAAPDRSTTKDWQRRDAAHHVHSFTDPEFIETTGSRIIEHAAGCTVVDSEGHRVLDGMAGLWCVNAGYGREELVAAAARQMRELPYYNNHFQSTTKPVIALAERLAQLTPAGLSHFYFGSSGSEANDTIVRLVRRYWRLEGKPDRTVFVSRTLAYHGTTLVGASLGGMPPMHGMDGTPLGGFEHIEHPHWYLLGRELSPEAFGIKAAAALERKILEVGADRVAAFIAEPVQGAGGVIVPPPGYWGEIQRICRKYDVLLVADEVVCGFGRTGAWFGSQTLGIRPDLMTMAKGLSSGYLPISAVAIGDRLYDRLRTGGMLAHGYTYSGHPVACAVALANLDILEKERLVDYVREEIGPYFQQRLGELCAEHPMVGELRGIGLMAGLQLVRSKSGPAFFEPHEEPAIYCREACYRHGLISRAVGKSMILSPPLVISRGEVDQLTERMRRALDETAERFGVSP